MYTLNKAYNKANVSSRLLSLFSLLLRLLVDTVTHFPQSLEEVTVTVSDERMWVRNHVEEEGNFFFITCHILLFSPVCGVNS